MRSIHVVNDVVTCFLSILGPLELRLGSSFAQNPRFGVVGNPGNLVRHDLCHTLSWQKLRSDGLIFSAIEVEAIVTIERPLLLFAFYMAQSYNIGMIRSLYLRYLRIPRSQPVMKCHKGFYQKC